jgi:hypothetical protein
MQDKLLSIHEVRVTIGSVFEEIQRVYSNGTEGNISHGDIEALKRSRDDLQYLISHKWTINIL